MRCRGQREAHLDGVKSLGVAARACAAFSFASSPSVRRSVLGLQGTIDLNALWFP